MFLRTIDSELIQTLKNEPLFVKRLLNDINSGEVFPAIRKNVFDFYHKGGRLFTYDGKAFRTHIKYASVYRLDEAKDYVTQDDLNDPKKCDFIDDYVRIKENCALYSGVEAAGVSQVYKNSYAKVRSGACVLDIEISLRSDQEGRKQDRIDLLLLNDGVLRFYEAKHFSNQAIWAKEGSDPEVVGQIRRYEKQIADKRLKIIEQYQNYVEVVNKLFGLKIEPPTDLISSVPILVFGFDRDQLNGPRFKTLFEANLEGKVKYYPIGDIAGIKINNMWAAKE
jgi:hypothetical protein